MILIAYIVFITIRGELPSYISLLRGSTVTGDAPSGVAENDNKNGGLITDIVNSNPLKIEDYYNSPLLNPLDLGVIF